MKFKSVIREKIVKESFAKTTVISWDSKGISKAVPLEEQQKGLHTMGGVDFTDIIQSDTK